MNIWVSVFATIHCRHPLQGTNTAPTRDYRGNTCAANKQEPGAYFIIPHICPLCPFSIAEPQHSRADIRMQSSTISMEPRTPDSELRSPTKVKCLQRPRCLPLCCTCDVCLPSSSPCWLLLNPRLKSDAKNLLLTSSAQIFEKSSHPPQEEGAGKERERGCPKLAWL